MPLGANPNFSQVRAFFGGSVNFKDYYRGGPYVPNIPANAGISTTIAGLRLSQFSFADNNVAQPLSVVAPSVYNQVNSGTAQGQSVAQGSGGAGGYSYTWVNNATGAAMGVNGAGATFTATRSISGSATVTVRDAANNTASFTISVELVVGRPI